MRVGMLCRLGKHVLGPHANGLCCETPPDQWWLIFQVVCTLCDDALVVLL